MTIKLIIFLPKALQNGWVFFFSFPACPVLPCIYYSVAVCYNFTTTIHTQTNIHAERGSSKAPRAGDREQQEGEEGYR